MRRVEKNVLSPSSLPGKDVWNKNMFRCTRVGFILAGLWMGLAAGLPVSAQQEAKIEDPSLVLATFREGQVTYQEYFNSIRYRYNEIYGTKPNYPPHEQLIREYALCKILSATTQLEPTRTILAKSLRWDLWLFECKEAYTRLSEEVFYPNTEPSSEQAKNYYAEHLLNLTPAKEFSFRSIFLDTTRCSDEACRTEKEKNAGEIYSALQARITSSTGALSLDDFLSVASEKTGLSTAEFGLRGPFPVGEINPDLERAAWALEPGQISSAVKTRTGLHIIRLETKTTGEPPTFEEKEKEIRSRLRTTEISRRRRSFRDAYAAEDRMVILPEGMKALIQWATAPAEVKDTTLAIAGDFSVSVLDYLHYVRSFSRDQIPDKDQTAEQIEKIHRDSLRNYIMERDLLRQQAVLMGMTHDATYTSRIETGKTWMLGKKCFVMMVGNRIRRVPPPTDEEVRAHYQKNISKYLDPAKYQIREIAIQPRSATNPYQTEIAYRESEVTALKALEEIKAGSSEEKVVQKYSSGEEAHTGGVTGYLLEGIRYSHGIWQELLHAQAGQWLPSTFRHRGQVMAIKLESLIPAKQKTVEECWDAISDELLGIKRGEIVRQLEQDLTRQAGLKLEDENIRKLPPLSEWVR